MGLAASQARLLFITSRQNDVSGKMQRISNDKMSLARDEDEVYQTYNRMLNTPKYRNADGTDLSYNEIMGAGASALGITTIITDYTGRVVLTNDAASRLGLGATGNGSAFSGSVNLDANFIRAINHSEADAEAIIEEIENPHSVNGPTDPTLEGDPPPTGTWYNVLEENWMDEYGEYKFDKQKSIKSVLNSDLNGCGISADIGLSDWTGDHLLFNANNTYGDIEFSGSAESPKLNIDPGSYVSGNQVVMIGRDSSGSSTGEGVAKDNARKIISQTAKIIGNAVGISEGTATSRCSAFIQNMNTLITKSTAENHGKGSEAKAVEAARADAVSGIVGHARSAGRDYYFLNLGEVTRRTAVLVLDQDDTEVDKINDASAYNTYSNQTQANTSAPKVQVNNKFCTKERYQKDLRNCFDALLKNKMAQYPNAPQTADELISKLEAGDHGTSGSSGEGGGEGGETLPEVDPVIQNKAAYYQNLYNALCNKGWTSADANSIQQNLDRGLYYVSDDAESDRKKISESDDFIEGRDKEMEAKAEAWYNSEIKKINRKEDKMDTEMNKLQTEYSSLTSDRESVQQIIQKNIEKSFKFCTSA